MEKKTLDLFKVMVVSEDQKLKTPYTIVERGLVLNFAPTHDQISILTAAYEPLDMTTLFSREEREHANVYDLITKQLLHYVEVYGLDSPGLFDLEVKNGQLITMTYIRGVTQTELGEMVRDIIYRNAPVKDTKALRDIIRHHKIDFDINRVANNEMRVILFEPDVHTFDSGDDAVRWICYHATEDTLLIKSRKVIEMVKASAFRISNNFLKRHEVQLAKVFNRHKRIILSLKTTENKTLINRIARLSKTRHVPIREALNKTFIAKALKGEIVNLDASLSVSGISVRDKFKYLNLLEYKRLQNETDMFMVRNGKAFIKENRKVYSIDDIDRVQRAVLKSLKEDMQFLKGTKILLDPNVHYGLPISRKQTLGHLPYGTKIITNGQRISSGMYWEDKWGAKDLDLSAVDKRGNRTGWASAPVTIIT